MLTKHKQILGLLFGSTISLTADARQALAVIRLPKTHREGAPPGRCFRTVNDWEFTEL